jgi:hypothetical protein
MFRASSAISLLLLGSAVTAWTWEQDRRDRFYAQNQNSYPATQPYYNGGHYYAYGNHGWYSYGGGYGGGYGGYGDRYSSSSHVAAPFGIERGGFGAIGHSFGGHS